MFITSIDYDEGTSLSRGQCIVAQLLEEAGYTWGIWYSDDEPCSSHNYERSKTVWEISTNATPRQMRLVMLEAWQQLAGRFSCYHEHDCCGCPFLTRFEEATLPDTFEDEKNYIIIESYSRNV